METTFMVHVLFRFSEKSGDIDTVMTGIGNAMMRIWALNNTPNKKCCMVVERDTGNIVFATRGTVNDFPAVYDKDLGSCTEYGISLEELQSITDDRFDC